MCGLRVKGVRWNAVLDSLLSVVVDVVVAHGDIGPHIEADGRPRRSQVGIQIRVLFEILYPGPKFCIRTGRGKDEELLVPK